MTTLTSTFTQQTATRVKLANAAATQRFPTVAQGREPVHVVYGGAHLFQAGVSAKMGNAALKSMSEHASDAQTFAAAVGIATELADRVYARVQHKLQTEPVEDFRIDFEDGYGVRADADEDGDAIRAADEVVAGMAQKSLPPFIGIRTKAFSDEHFPRALRTLDLFVSRVVKSGTGALPPHFVVTQPKVTTPAHTKILAEVLEQLERGVGLKRESIGIEVMIEDPRALIGGDGVVALPHIVDAARGRLVAAHFGPYDFSASNDITALHQTLDHDHNDFARTLMKNALYGSGVRVADGPTTTLPIAPHRGNGLSQEQRIENAALVHAAWKLHAENVRRSLAHGYHQSWDLHPAQLPARYGALFALYAQALPVMSERLRKFAAAKAHATRVGQAFDDAATVEGIVAFFVRGVACGACAVWHCAGWWLAAVRLSAARRVCTVGHD